MLNRQRQGSIRKAKLDEPLQVAPFSVTCAVPLLIIRKTTIPRDDDGVPSPFKEKSTTFLQSVKHSLARLFVPFWIDRDMTMESSYQPRSVVSDTMASIDEHTITAPRAQADHLSPILLTARQPRNHIVSRRTSVSVHSLMVSHFVSPPRRCIVHSDVTCTPKKSVKPQGRSSNKCVPPLKRIPVDPFESTRR